MAEDLISYFSDKDISTLVLINPDNPTGSYIPKEGLLRLIEWTKENGVKLVVDESFADFADEPDNTLIDEAVINDNPHLFVMKSISKSFGVPGLRLGVLVSSDADAISSIKKDVSIWNINSFGEFYLQIYEKYAKYSVASPVKAMCLNIAHDCQLRCKYCFASTGDFGKGRKLMSLETGKHAIDFLLENSGDRPNLELDFFGGEPLMNFKVVKQIVEYARSREKEFNKKFRFTITTNGLLLDDEKIDFIAARILKLYRPAFEELAK